MRQPIVACISVPIYLFKLITILIMFNQNTNQLLRIAEYNFHIKNYDFSESALHQILLIDPNHAKANELLAYINEYKGNIELAYQFLITACQSNSCSIEALYRLGASYLESARPEEALTYLTRVIELDNGYFEGLHDIGTALAQLGRFDESLSFYHKASAIRSDVPQLFFNLGRLYDEVKRPSLALENYDIAIALEPNFADAWRNKGTTLLDLKKYSEAFVCLERSLNLNPTLCFVLGDMIHAKMKIGDWNNIGQYTAKLFTQIQEGKAATNPFTLFALSDDPALHKQCAEIYSNKKYPYKPTLGPLPQYSIGQKIRLGYFSADFRSHAVSFLMAELFELHNKDRFEIVAFSYGIDDQSPIRNRLSQAFDQFIDVRSMTDRQIAELARKLKIDISIDLGGHTHDSRTGIFAYKASPIQVNYLGYPGTLGAAYIDYIIADLIIIPDSKRSLYTEKIACLPNSYMVDDSKRIPSNRDFSRADFSLPEGVIIFCCFNNDYKFNKGVLESWSRILLAVENSVLWIHDNNECFKKNLKKEFEKLNIGSSRIIFSPRIELMSDHLARYALADLFLDTFPYNAHTTAVDSLKAGVPVLTILGESFAGRVAASLLNALDLNDLVTTSQTEYESLAIELATCPEKLMSIKRRLQLNLLTKTLFSPRLFTRDIESIYLRMMERHWAGLAPDHIQVRPSDINNVV